MPDGFDRHARPFAPVSSPSRRPEGAPRGLSIAPLRAKASPTDVGDLDPAGRTEGSMDTFLIEGGHPLSGEITVAGNKNAALPLLAATLLSEEPVTLGNVPNIRDVRVLKRLLQHLGCRVTDEGTDKVIVEAKTLEHTRPDPELSRNIRASFALAGPLLAREGKADLAVPGGDRIGRRPLDTHIQAFRALGAECEIKDGNYKLRAKKGLKGADIFLEEMSVLATENVVMAAALAKGTTVLRNAASEPHVQDLCHLINAMGGAIEGIGTNTLVIEGRERLSGAELEVGPDYIEVGSFIALAALSGGRLTIKRTRPEDYRMMKIAFGRLGVTWEDDGTDLIVPADQPMQSRDGLHGAMAKIHDAPWPGFPADLTSIATVLATGVKGTVLIHEWMYESRLYWVDRLISMGARIIVCDPHRAVIEGPCKLYGRTMSSPDIRAGMALLIAALVADGRSTIQNAQQIDRGYQNIEHRLRALGAHIERV
jgi:UDP-N-acetylglucosamine 1-carboxyvinyltransferase